MTAVMPRVPAEGVVERTLFLPTDAVGVPSSDLDHPIETIAGRPSPSAVSTWSHAPRVDCDVAPAAGEVCIPGGAFWLGSASLKEFRYWFDPDAGARRLAVLAPFAIDSHEVTVAQFRSAGFTTNPWSESPDGGAAEDWCTFTAAAGPHENFPVNCVDRKQARAYCQSLGKDLPTEAQFEYVAGALRSNLWPWGSEVPSCKDAIVARSYLVADVFTTSQACRGARNVDAPLPVGSASRDRVDSPSRHGGSVFDLVGNVSEFTRDTFQFRSDVCWVTKGLYFEPICDRVGTAPPGIVIKGGNWAWTPALSLASLRWPASAPSSSDPWIGFRCVRRL